MPWKTRVWVSLKPAVRIQELIHVSQEGSRSVNIQAVHHHLPRQIGRKLNWRGNSQDTNQNPNMECWQCHTGLKLSYPTVSPTSSFIPLNCKCHQILNHRLVLLPRLFQNLQKVKFSMKEERKEKQHKYQWFFFSLQTNITINAVKQQIFTEQLLRTKHFSVTWFYTKPTLFYKEWFIPLQNYKTETISLFQDVSISWYKVPAANQTDQRE